MVIPFILVPAAALRRLGNVVEDHEREGLDAPQGFVKRNCYYFQNLIMKELPLTAIKIVVVVGQILVHL